MAFIHRMVGRRIASVLVGPISRYFCWRYPEATRASLDYLRTLRSWTGGRSPDHEPVPGDGLRHIHSFATNIYDRLIAWGGGFASFHFDHRGSEHLFHFAETGQGGILLGAHLGSFDMPRILAGRYGVVLNVLMFTDHAERITSFFERLDPESAIRVLRLDPSNAQTGFAVKACVERGEFVAILADRVPPGSREQCEVVDFLGRPARFPLSPFLLACALGCPLLTSMCVRTGEDRYEAVVEVLSAGGKVARRDRQRRAREMLRRYVATLEHYCEKWPYQWFNFYDYWSRHP
jgi:predicted LPLAT superfamily acyltransferase